MNVGEDQTAGLTTLTPPGMGLLGPGFLVTSIQNVLSTEL